MSVRDFYEKRIQLIEEEAKDYARSIEERFGRELNATDLWEEFPLFVDTTILKIIQNCKA